MPRKRNSQIAWIVARLEQGPLTSLQAILDGKVTRLAARIYELRRAGMEIASEMVEVDYGSGPRRYAKYYLIKHGAPVKAPNQPDLFQKGQPDVF